MGLRASEAQAFKRFRLHVGSGFFVVKPSTIIFLIQDTIPQKEDIILRYIEYHSIPKYYSCVCMMR